MTGPSASPHSTDVSLQERNNTDTNTDSNMITTLGSDCPLHPIQKHLTTLSFNGIRPKRYAGAWTRAEDQILRNGVRAGQAWNEIAATIAERSAGQTIRTPEQCSQRWCRTLNPAIKKGPWSHDESLRLRRGIEMYGTSAWTLVARHVGGRTDIQCRTRWLQDCQRSLTRAKPQKELEPLAIECISKEDDPSIQMTVAPIHEEQPEESESTPDAVSDELESTEPPLHELEALAVQVIMGASLRGCSSCSQILESSGLKRAMNQTTSDMNNTQSPVPGAESDGVPVKKVRSGVQKASIAFLID